MDFYEKARWWSYRRQRLGQDAPGAGEALRSVVGVYSSHPTAPLSLHARVRGFEAGAFRRLDEDRIALRVQAMRGSIHLLSRESAHLAFRVTGPSTSAQRSRLRYGGVSVERYDELKSVILKHLAKVLDRPASWSYESLLRRPA